MNNIYPVSLENFTQKNTNYMDGFHGVIDPCDRDGTCTDCDPQTCFEGPFKIVHIYNVKKLLVCFLDITM